MPRGLQKDDWIKWFKLYEKENNPDVFWKKYFKDSKLNFQKRAVYSNAKTRFKIKYQLANDLGYNEFMKTTKKRNSKKKKIDNSDLPDLIKGLTRKQLEQVAKEYFKEKRENKNKNIDKTKKKLSFLTISELSRLLNVCRTNFYKKKVTRKYKYDNFKKVIVQEFNANKSIYGRLRLSIILKQKHNIDINSRTLGHYLNRYGCYCKIRIAKKKRELKQLNVSYPDLVQRNYNPQKDNIIATDVSYIRADEHNNFVYLSIAINHKSKLIESWELSTKNNDKLVYDTMKKIRHIDNLIVHSDHGAPYSSDIIVKLSKQRKYKISMSRVGNSLDNREAEYFFSCIKSECLKFVRTSTMKIATIKKVIKKYISWYNNFRIQSKLNWMAPAKASV